MKLGRIAPWLKDARVAVGACCLGAGFLLGLLVFGTPWHLPPAWGDIPTWILAVFAVIAGVVGYVQLQLLRQQLDEEQELNAKRDALFDTQLADAQRRTLAEQRAQAEAIEVGWLVDEERTRAFVTNKSRRPIRHVSCKTLVFLYEDKAYLVTKLTPLSEVERLRPQVSCTFTTKALARRSDQVLVVWFTDDAGFRWQLDEYLHLVPAADNDEYVP